MKNDKQKPASVETTAGKEERPVLYIRLLSYPNACKVIDFIKANDREDYAHITPGGVSTQVSVKNWDKVIDFLTSLKVRYEVTPQHPEKVNSEIVQGLKAMGIIEDKNVIKVAVGGYTDDEAKEVIRRRHQIVLDYCKEKGWEPHPEKLSIQQIMEIRHTSNWKEVPQKVKEEIKQT